MNTPRWDGERWRIQERRDGKRFSFSSNIPGPKGRKECLRKYEAWYFGEVSGEKTVAQVANEYLKDVKARRGEDSPAYEQYERYIRLYILPKCGYKKICKMSLRDWQSIINESTGKKKPLSEKALKTLRGVITGIIRFGYQDYQCELPRGDLYIPKGHPKREKEILQPEDLRRLFEPSELFYHPLFVFLALTGMRPGEALGLTIDDVLSDRVIIRRSVNARGQITDGKNENARRLIPLGALASGVIRKTIQRNKDLNLRTKYIFCSPDGSIGNQSTMRNHWIILKKERNLPSNSSVYSLRHTFISMVKNVLPESQIKSVVGHSVSMQTIGGTYDHYIDGEEKQIAEIIDLRFGATFGASESTIGEQTE